MRRPPLLLLAAAPVLLAASSPVVRSGPTADSALKQAQAEAIEAARKLRALEDEAAKAQTEADRLRAEQVAAAAAIEVAEAQISESTAKLRLARAQVALAERRLERQRAPLAAMLAGLATMGRQPPLLALADHGSIDELVRIKALLDATMPVIERRSTALKKDLGARKKLEQSTELARIELARGRDELADRRRRFAELEVKAAGRATQLAGEAIGVGDQVLASDEMLSTAGADAAARRSALRNAGEVAALGLAPARPMRGDSALAVADFNYSLPVLATLTVGLGTVSRAGIVSRGISFDTAPGAAVIAPADGKILFAAPYRGRDGLVIIEHEGGWTSLLLGVASDRPKGTKVRRGELLGRALGPIEVELRRNGQPVSPALIAASSVPLSNGRNNR